MRAPGQKDFVTNFISTEPARANTEFKISTILQNRDVGLSQLHRRFSGRFIGLLANMLG